MEEEIRNVSELYKKVYPALMSKRKELKKFGLIHIKEEDIWNYLKEKKWKKSVDLSLSELVNDILECSINDLEDHMIKEMSQDVRIANLEDWK